MIDWLLPSTNTAVALQGLVAIVLLGGALWINRYRRDRTIFLVGLSVLTVAGFGLRALH